MRLVTSDTPILWTPAQPVTNLLLQAKPYLPWMAAFLIRTRGHGLAAPQIGVGLRFFAWRNVTVSLVINPVITDRSTEDNIAVEGCFSFPGKQAAKRRHNWIQVSYLDETGREFNRRLEGLTARIFQHEIDHLNGVNIFPRPNDSA